MNLYEAKKKMNILTIKKSALAQAHNILCKENAMLQDEKIQEHIDMIYQTIFELNIEIGHLHTKIYNVEITTFIE